MIVDNAMSAGLGPSNPVNVSFKSCELEIDFNARGMDSCSKAEMAMERRLSLEMRGNPSFWSD